MAKMTPNEKRLAEEKRLEKHTQLGLAFNEDKGGLKSPDLKRLITGDTGYGTSRSQGAVYAAGQVQDKLRKKTGDSFFETADNPDVRQARREAAAEERRESRGMAKGGMTASKRADGCCVKGKTKGRMV
jgi:hypothetical protein